MANPKSAMFDRISKLSKSAPLHESGATSAGEPQLTESVPLTTTEAEKRTEADQPGLRRKTKAVRRAKNVQIPEDLWDAYDQLKERNVTSLLMTPYILEAFREKLMRDGAFEKK